MVDWSLEVSFLPPSSFPPFFPWFFLSSLFLNTVAIHSEYINQMLACNHLCGKISSYYAWINLSAVISMISD